MSGSANASGDSGALGKVSWFWGFGTGQPATTALDYDRNYRLSVVTPVPALGWA